MITRGCLHKAIKVHFHKTKKTPTATSSPRFIVYCPICDTEWQTCRKELTLIDWIAGIFCFECWKCETKHRVIRVAKDCYEQTAS